MTSFGDFHRRRPHGRRRTSKELNDQAAVLVQTAEAQLADAQPLEAASTSCEAWLSALAGGATEIQARARLIWSYALAVLDELSEARFQAQLAALLLASEPRCAGGKLHAWAVHQTYEVSEMLGEFALAREGFSMLAGAFYATSGWQVDLQVNICNHLVSIGVKTGDLDLAVLGTRRGQHLADRVLHPDERAAFDQWRAILELHRSRPDSARALLEQSFVDRSKTGVPQFVGARGRFESVFP